VTARTSSEFRSASGGFSFALRGRKEGRKESDHTKCEQDRGDFYHCSTPSILHPASPKAERTKRLTLDVRESLHRRIKVTWAAKGEDMAIELRRLLETGIPEPS
jgi:hypothetical protein